MKRKHTLRGTIKRYKIRVSPTFTKLAGLREKARKGIHATCSIAFLNDEDREKYACALSFPNLTQRLALTEVKDDVYFESRRP